MTPEIAHLLQYNNDRVIARYGKDYPLSKMNPEESWAELMKFIWLWHKHQSEKKLYPENELFHFTCVIHSEMQDIDNMWHTFLLFTRDYHQFCVDYLHGVFFHHEPLSDSIQLEPNEYEEELTRYLSYIYDNLGEETLLKWFGDF